MGCAFLTLSLSRSRPRSMARCHQGQRAGRCSARLIINSKLLPPRLVRTLSTLPLPRCCTMRNKKPSHSARIISNGRAIDNSAEFHGYLSKEFKQRYAGLFEALAQPVQHVALLNAFTDVNDTQCLGMTSCYRSGPVACLRLPEATSSYPPPPQCPYTQLKLYYWLDFASLLPPLLLNVQRHHVVLDMCSAPGGKSLVLAMQLLSSHLAQQQGSDMGLSKGLLQQLSVQNRPDQQQLQNSQEHSQQQQQQQQQQPQQQQQQPITQAESIQHHNWQAGVDQNNQQLQQQQNHTALPSDKQGSDNSSVGNTSSHDSDQDFNTANSNSSSLGRLVCNELDIARRARLNSVIHSYIPGSLRRHVRIVGHDATKHWSRFEQGLYDRVLVDAPCSSERHVVHQALAAGGAVASSSWSVKQCEGLAALQLQLLLAGLEAVKPGGRLVYSTCSLAAAENDNVVEMVLQKCNNKGLNLQQGDGCTVRAVQVAAWDCSAELMDLLGLESTKYGGICTPDKQGWGPIYAAVLHKDGPPSRRPQ